MEDGNAQNESFGKRLVAVFWAITPRQRFVLYLFIQGWGIPDIAEYLSIKERTVKTYMNLIRHKAKEIENAGGKLNG